MLPPGPSVFVPLVCSAAQTGSGSLQVNQWQHLAGTYDGANIIIYLNGNVVARASQSGLVSPIDFLILGIWESSFNGLMDEVRMWNISRTQAQIQTDMGHTLTGTEPGLVGYWRFDEGSGQTVLDFTGGGNDGRLGTSTGSDGSDPLWSVSDAPITYN